MYCLILQKHFCVLPSWLTLQCFNITGWFGVSEEQSLATWTLACVLCVKKAGHKGSWCFFALAGFSLYTPSSPDVLRLLGCLSWGALLSSLLLHTDLALLSFVGYHWCMLERLWGWVFDHARAVFSINLSKDKTVISYFSDELSSDEWLNSSKSSSTIIWLKRSSMCRRNHRRLCSWVVWM